MTKNNSNWKIACAALCAMMSSPSYSSSIPSHEGEYGIFILANGQVKEAALEVNKTHKKQHADKTFADTNPHITLAQGKFDDLDVLLKQVEAFAKAHQALDIKMDSKIVQGGGGNTFWDVDRASESWETLQAMNASLCTEHVPHPVGKMKQVMDDLKDTTTDEEERVQIEEWGRAFNIPGANRPHITVVYGFQDQELMAQINFTPEQLSFLASEVCVGKVNEVGNLVGQPIASFKFCNTEG